MNESMKNEVYKKDIKFQERLEYLIRDISLLEQDVMNIQNDFKNLLDEFSEIKSVIEKENKKRNEIVIKDKKNEKKQK